MHMLGCYTRQFCISQAKTHDREIVNSQKYDGKHHSKMVD